MRSAKRPYRPEAEFFADPTDTAQRRYEALRAYFLEGTTAAQAAARFGYAEASVQAMVRDFRAGDRAFFARRRPGPAAAPAKQAAPDQVLRQPAPRPSTPHPPQHLATPAAAPCQRRRRGAAAGPRPGRPGPARGGQRRAPARHPRGPRPSQCAQPAGAQGDRPPPRLPRRRRRHRPALATFAGLESLPKATALGTYSYRLARRHQQALLAALGPAMLRTGQAAGTDFDLDFHAIMHYGHDVAVETHYVPRRSQRTESVLTFFAQDGQTHNLVYAGATCTKTSQAGEVMAFARHWQQATGKLPELLVFDSTVTTGAGLFALDQAGIGFLTLRARNAKLMQTLDALPTSAWTRITLDRTGPYRHPQVHEDHVKVRGCPVWLRQLAVRGLGHDQPTLILTNNHTAKPAKLVGRYAQRMTIEQRLAEQIRSFHLDALSSAVALNVDLDTTLTVWAQAAYDALRRRLPGYATATPDTIWRRFVSTSGQLTLGPTEVVARIAERTYSPVLRSADLPEVEVPWWGGRRLRFEIAVGKK